MRCLDKDEDDVSFKESFFGRVQLLYAIETNHRQVHLSHDIKSLIAENENQHFFSKISTN